MNNLALIEIQRADNVLSALGWTLVKQELVSTDTIHITFERKFPLPVETQQKPPYIQGESSPV